MACASSVRLTRAAKEPREDEARWFCIKREARRSVDSPWIARDAVWQHRKTRC